ncbi:MAG TPA: hybrid sensor histidine kinase/response regulator [Piscinibacter sp.]|jgi:signal transduction histidine kinase|nr:hybrid sensor histidine kinase/response regulator [Piscinibacter sp.]HPG79474.1 hybrid sensor histidine kinase/response regulator [Piscinibacter sp.]
MAQSDAVSPAMALPPAAAAPAAESAPRHSALGEEVLAVYAYTPATLAGLAAGFFMLVTLFWPSTPTALMFPWMALFIGLWFVRIVIARRFQSAVKRHEVELDWGRWRLYWNVLTLCSAGAWGLSGWLFFTRGLGIQQTGLILVIYTFCIAVVPVLANQPRMFIAYVVLCFGPLIVRIATGGDAYSYQLAGMLLIIITLTTVLARNYRQALARVIELKLRADDLLVQLRVEKQAAEAARHEAEVANRAKTQFFTAASHDLRQPLHAMGLFAEALRQRAHEPEVAQLVNSINASVDALEGLFSELLDITRIDNGGVEVHPQPFEVGDILRKLRLHFEPTAFEKGLALRLRGGARVVHADPLLVERILRNLVSNAIRYTNDGGVLVGARLRGDKVLLQVWDSGLGIRAEEQAKVFEEFYQVPNTPAVAPHQRKGLGLGLAIVKRLADLMGAPISLRSEAGRGTVFTLELPVGNRPRQPAAMPSSKGPLGLTLDGRLIVVVEDEPAVRSGLEVLLQGWGAQVLSFDSVAEAGAWAAAADPTQVRPDLLIVDYRLESGRNGVDAIQLLRGRFGAATPAIVVTGSTMSTLDKEAQEKDFHLLLKPVVPNKLRAMIAFKLGVKPV